MREVGVTEAEDFRAMENLEDVQSIPSINPVNLNYFGSEICEPGHSYGPHIRTSYVLHIVSSGSGRLMKAGRTYEISAGHAFLIYPGEETVYEADQISPWNYMWVGFHGMRAEEMMSRQDLPEKNRLLRAVIWRNFAQRWKGCWRIWS